MKQNHSPTEPSRLSDNNRCDVCGRFGAVRVDERSLCQDCYTGSGSCCPEFGKDDLWTFPENQPGQPKLPVNTTSQQTKNC